MPDDRTPCLELRVTGGLADREHRIPADLLTQVLTGLQRAVYLLAMAHEGVAVRQRERVSVEMQSKYALLCSPPQTGSVAMPVQIGDPARDVLTIADLLAVSEMLDQTAGALCAGDEQQLRKTIPDGDRRRRLVEAFKTTIPKAGSGYQVSLSRDAMPLFDTVRWSRHVKTFTAATTPIDDVRTVTGKLVEMAFDKHRIKIVYLPTHQEMECFYDESVEEMLLGRPRELVHVTGEVRLNEDGVPLRIVDVSSIQEVDLSPFRLESFDYESYRLAFRTPVEVAPQLSEDQQYMALVHEPLGIDLLAQTRDELDSLLREELALLWSQFAEENDDMLSPKAQELKHLLLETIQKDALHG